MKKCIIVILRILLFIICIGIFIYIALVAIDKRILKLEFKNTLTAESSKDVDNPYRGFYNMYGYELTDNPDDADNWYTSTLADDKEKLILLEVNLDKYADTDISKGALTSLDNLLRRLKRTKKQIIIRFLYDWDGKALMSEPGKIERICSHMEQVADTVNKYKDNIFILQGIFTGNCGEMSGSNYTSEEDISLLMNTLSTVIDPAIYLSVRTPAQLRGILKSHRPLAYNSPHSGTLPSRLGLFNDGMLGSVYAVDTYDDTSYKDYKVFLEAGTREEELEFQNELCQYVPNGGEVVIDNVYNDIKNAVTDLNTMHISYLNSAHDTAVLEKWKQSDYKGTNGYEYIASHLGYRYVITDCTVDFRQFLGTSASLDFTITNTGFAPSYKKFNTELIVKNTETKETVTYDVAFDNCALQSGHSMILTVSLPVRSYNPGTYELLLSITDDTLSVPIMFGNENSSPELKLGTMTID